MVCDAKGSAIGGTLSAADAAVIVTAHNQAMAALRQLVDKLGAVPVEPTITGFTVKNGKRVNIVQLSESDSYRYNLWTKIKEIVG
jgi:hypothetical protein